MRTHVILAAGGSGSRMNSGINKIFLPLCGFTILYRSIRLFEGIIDDMVIVCRNEDMSLVKKTADSASVSFPVSFTVGGDTRQHSVLNGLSMLQSDKDDIILIHDAARCLTDRKIIDECISACREFGSAVPGIPAVNTMKYCDSDGFVRFTADRTDLYEIQTPQAFYYESLLHAHKLAEHDLFSATDDASLLEHAGVKVKMIEGSRSNIKITEKEDLFIAESYLKQNSAGFRIGTGYDVHRLVEGRELILCGVCVSHKLGLLGHSDADVAAHALMDAMLGAASLGDIGKHFPDSDEEFRGISSMILLQRVVSAVSKAGYRFVNADVTIVAQRPKLSPYIPEMIRTLCGIINCKPDQINIKATTTEKLGFEGREEGISAQAVCLLEKTH